jgi:hypothetical protein
MGRKKSAAQVAGAAAAAATRAALRDAGGGEDDVEIRVDDPEEELEQDAMASLAAIGGEGEGIKYVLRCISPLDKKGTIDQIAQEELPDLVFMIRDRYGPGKYTITAYGPNGFIKGGHRTITVSPLTSRRDSAAAQAAAPLAASSSMQEWLQREEAREERRRQEAREDRKFYLQLAVTALPAILGGRESVGSLITALGGLREMTGGGNDKALEALTRGLEIGKDLGNHSESWPAIIRDTVKDLAGSPVGQRLITRVAAAAPAVAPAAAPGPVKVPYLPPQSAGAIPVPNPPPAAATPAPEGIPEPIWVGIVLPTLNKLSHELLDFAANGADPGLAAEALIAKIPRALQETLKQEQPRAQVLAALRNPGWWPMLKDFRPELEPYEGYCDDVRMIIIKLMTEPESEPEQP